MDKVVLVVDDERPILDILKYNLEKEGYKVVEATDGDMAVEKAFSVNPDIILLDVMLPKLDGFEVCKKIREKMATPILMITAREEELDKVLGLELGADDYIVKPFSIREVLARVKANLRRTKTDSDDSSNNAVSASQSTKSGNLSINFDRYEVKKKNQIIDLTLREFELLRFLVNQPEKIFTRETLLEKVWGYEYYGDVRTVDVTIRRLREKIEDDPGMPEFIITKRGVGYYFNAKG